MSPVSAAAMTASRRTSLERRAYEHRLVEERLDLELRRKCRLDARQGVLHALDDVEGRGGGRLQYREQRREPAVDVDHVGLHGEPVAHLCDVAHVHRGAADLLHRDVVQRLEDVGR
jgi:hypothetical protein